MDTAQVRLSSRRRSAALAAVAVALTSLLTLQHPAAGRERQVQVRGRLTDESGAPVPGQTVRLLKSRTIVDLKALEKRSQDVEQTRVTTDAHGFYEMSFTVDPRFRYYYLRFYDPKQFDAVKYRLPDDRDISRRARRGRPVHADAVFEFHPDWPEVKALIDRYGPATHVGQILRTLGLPTRRTPQASGRELWVYDPAGVSYLLEGMRVVQTRHRGDPADPPTGASAVRLPIPDPGLEEEEPEEP
ncbi:MAG: carboxypeptidase-like regulatory domain-containing protein [Acidobacteriota bacterium]